jgi:hypothetical protein
MSAWLHVSLEQSFQFLAAESRKVSSYDSGQRILVADNQLTSPSN